MQLGSTYALLDYIDRMVPNKRSIDPHYLAATLVGLKRIAIVQHENSWVTMRATTSAGVWIYFKGQRALLINPGQSYLRVETALGQDFDAVDIDLIFSPGIEGGDVVETGKTEFRQWQVMPIAIHLIWELIEAFERPSKISLSNDVRGDHPRYFPGDVREMALEEFERGGRICRGVANRVDPHGLGPDERVEFDHVLPYARGGASSAGNIQVLCVACNRLKAATAA